MSPRTSEDRSIGQRIKDRRTLLGWSIRHAASRAGIAHTTWSRIERGESAADNRFTVAAIAAALRCSVTDLTGGESMPVNADQAETGGAAYEAMRAVIEADLAYGPVAEAPPLDHLSRELDLVRDLRARCDYVGSARRLPGLVRGLHAAAFGPGRAAALRLLVVADESASFVVRYLGHPASACLVAERAQQAAEQLEDPVMLGLAAYARAHGATGCGLYQRALLLAETAAASLERHAGQPDAPEMLGQLLMTAGFAKYALGDTDGAAERVTAASEIAARTGQSPALALNFGPVNIDFWRISMETDGGDPGKAVELARATNPLLVESVSRQAAFYMDTGRALARVGKDQEALRMLLTAERLAPQRMRLPLMAETVRGLLERARRGAGWSELRGLAERLGVGT